MNANPVVRAVERELKHYPGVRMELDESGGRHSRMLFEKNGTSRFLTVPRTPSDFRAPKNAVRDFRKTMKELGAEPLPERKRSKRISDRFPASLTLNEKSLMVSFPRRSPLLARFKTKDDKATGVWTAELIASPDLAAPPLLSLKRSELPADGSSHYGFVKGFSPAPGAGWKLQYGRGVVAALGTLGTFTAEGLRLYKDNGDELVFQLPAATLPTGFVARQSDPEPEPEDDQPEPVEARETAAPAARPAAEPVDALRDKPITLQFPKQAVSVEAAIGILNKAKARLGSNLRFTIEEGGFLSAVHRIGK